VEWCHRVIPDRGTFTAKVTAAKANGVITVGGAWKHSSQAVRELRRFFAEANNDTYKGRIILPTEFEIIWEGTQHLG
jgi:hypothetical protein